VVTVPPEAETRYRLPRPRIWCEDNYAVLFHVLSPRRRINTPSALGRLITSTFFSFPSAKNAMERLSGDQNGKLALQYRQGYLRSVIPVRKSTAHSSARIPGKQSPHSVPVGSHRNVTRRKRHRRGEIHCFFPAVSSLAPKARRSAPP